MTEGGLRTNAWQDRMLPLMQRMIIGLTLFFFLASFAQLYFLHQSIGQAPRIDLSSILPNSTIAQDSEQSMSVDAVHSRALLLLEANALERRHHQANVLLMSRVWVRYLGFVTGMILALVGAVFILGKLREPASEINAEGKLVSIAVRSASPGIVLAFLGVTLMLATIVTHHEIQVRDVPVFVGGPNQTPASARESAKPSLDN
jgi:hypothetical protein